MKKSGLIVFFCISISSLKSQSIFDTLTFQEKVKGISAFWKEASYNFVFFDKLNINWDSCYYEYLPLALKSKNVYEYHKVLSKFAYLLNDGHTYIGNADYFYKDLGTFPIFFKKFGTKRLVSKVAETLEKEIPLGSELIAIDNITPDSFYRSGNTLSGIKGTENLFTFKRKDSSTFSKTIKRIAGKDQIKYISLNNNDSWKSFENKELDNGIYYISINTFADSAVVSKFKNLIPRINSSKALIIDIRNNGGGNSDYARQIANHLVDKPFTIGSVWKSRISNSANKAFGSAIVFGNKDEITLINQHFYLNNAWEYHNDDTLFINKSIEKVKVPIVVLTGNGTYSAAEDFLIFLDGSKNVKLLGENTAGSSGQPLYIELVKGFGAMICAKRDSYPDGRDFINVGIKPDIFVKQTIENYLDKVDTQFQAAISYCLKIKK
jgi:carboxyl-terminal processing protease